MCSRMVVGAIFIFVFLQNAVAGLASREKRCIVIQKQSGTRGESAESDGDEDYRRPKPKEPMPDRLRTPAERNYETEEIQPEWQRTRKRFDRLRQKKPNRYSNLRQL